MSANKFKVGPAVTRDGRDAVIYEVTDKWIYGRIGFEVFRWHAETGKLVQYLTDQHLDDLMPPLREWWFVKHPAGYWHRYEREQVSDGAEQNHVIEVRVNE